MGQGSSKSLQHMMPVVVLPLIESLTRMPPSLSAQKETHYNLAIIGADGVMAINPIDFFTGTFCLQTTTWEITLFDRMEGNSLAF